MTRTEAEIQYQDAYRSYVAARDALRQASKEVYNTRGIELPYSGPMKNKVRHADRRLNELEFAVIKELYGPKEV